MSQQIQAAVEVLLDGQIDNNSKKNLANLLVENPESASIAYKYCMDEYESRLEKAFDDESRSTIYYGTSLVVLICTLALKKVDLPTIDDIFGLVDTRGLCICIERCTIEKNLRYVRILKSALGILSSLTKSGKYCRSMDGIFEIHQAIMQFFEEMGCLKQASSSDGELEKEVNSCLELYTDFLLGVVTEESFKQVDENFTLKYILLCKGLFSYSFFNENCNKAFLYLFTEIPQAVATIQEITISRRKQKDTKLDMLKDVVAEVCDTLQNKKAMVRKCMKLLLAIVTSYMQLLEDQKEIILRAIMQSNTRMLLMPRKSELVLETLNICTELTIAMKPSEAQMDTLLTIKTIPSSHIEMVNATSKTFLLSKCLQQQKDSPYCFKYFEAIIKQIRFCGVRLSLSSDICGID